MIGDGNLDSDHLFDQGDVTLDAARDGH